MNKKFVAFVSAVLLLTSAGCGTGAPPSSSGLASSSQADPPKVNLTYPTYRVGAHVGAPCEQALLDKYHAAFGDKVTVKVEELPSDVSYADKMKILASTKELPDVVEGKNGIRELAIKNGQAIDLMPYLNANPDFKEQIGQEAIDANLIDGKLYSISQGQSLVGYYYNKDMFAKVGITPAKTWDEFMSNCEKLKAAGYTPLALMTGETCWTSNLILASIIGTSGEAGNKFMNTPKPTDYNTPELKKGLELMQTMLRDYTTSDALGGIYANAANNFCQEKTAMIANGPWMAPEFADSTKSVPGLSDRVGVAMWPENGMISEFFIGYMVCAKEKEQQDIAFNFIKEITDLDAQKIRLEHEGYIPLSSKVEMSEDFKKEFGLVAELVNLAPQVKWRYQTIDNIFPPAVIDVFPKYYPELANGRITVDGFIDELNKAAKTVQ